MSELTRKSKKTHIVVEPVEFFNPDDFILADEWVPEPEDLIFKTTKGLVVTDVSDYFGTDQNNNLDGFVMSTKRSYNSPEMRNHITQYLNYFEKFYDKEHMLHSAYCRIKFLIDYEPSYSKETFFFDIMKYIVRGPIEYKTTMMTNDNYSLNLNYKSRRNSSLQYNNVHGMLLMKISVQMNQIIPLLCHFMYVKKVQNTTDFLFEIYDKLIEHPDIDVYNKLYETAYSNVMGSVKSNQIIWKKQDIRGLDPVSHAIQCVQNILINIICKYDFSKNLVHYNYSSILRNTGYQITNIEYELAFVALSSSKRDEDQIKMKVPPIGNNGKELLLELLGIRKSLQLQRSLFINRRDTWRNPERREGMVYEETLRTANNWKSAAKQLCCAQPRNLYIGIIYIGVIVQMIYTSVPE